jgi:LPS-assembly protein
VQRFQTLQDPLAPILSPYHRLPQLNFGASRNDVGGLVDATVPAELVRFSHPTLVDGLRTSLNPSVSMPVLAPGWFVIPKAGLRYAGYRLHNVAPGQDRSQDVSIPWLSLDSGLIFERQMRWFGEERAQTLEPRLFYVYAPYRNQDQIPLFDTGLADFNYAQLFSENRFVGGDRFGDANQLTAALTSRLLGADGLEALRATVGRRYHWQAERVGLTPTSPLRTYRGSDLIGSVGGRIARSWTFDFTTQFNPRETRAERYTASARYSPEIAKVLSASYRFNRDILRQIDVSGQWPVGPGWYAVGRYNYSILDKRLVEGLGGIEYNAGCWVFRAVVQRIQTATQVSSTSLYLQLELTGIGQIGTGDVADLLKRNVPGYSVTNPKDQTLVPPSMRTRLPFEMVF